MPFKVAISGLRAAQTELNVIGNNVANVGTTGFKSSRAEFEDVYTLSNLGVASNSPGRGTNTSRIAQQFTQGNITFTDNNLDLAISGQGFFMVDDNGTTQYTREGAFSIDRDGYVVNANNQRLIVFGADAAGNILGSTEQFQVDTSNIPPNATTSLDLNINFDSEDQIITAPFDVTDPSTYNESTSTTVYDSLGGSHLMQNYYVKTGASTWSMRTYVDGNPISGPDTLTFNNNGTMVAPTTFATGAFVADPAAAPMNLSLNFGQSTQYGGSFDVNSLTQDGYPAGRLSGIDIDSDGVIFARFSNGQSQVQGQVALSNFSNPQGLNPVGGNNWSATFAAGDPVVGPPGSSSLGLVQSGALEDSNVDLSKELVALIIAQRNFQANTEVISTADTVTQSVINIR